MPPVPMGAGKPGKHPKNRFEKDLVKDRCQVKVCLNQAA